MSNSVDTMKNFFNILKLYADDPTANGIGVLDRAIRTTTRFAGLQDAINHFVADITNVTATQGVAQSLYQNCGIVLGADNDYNADTGAVSGYNAGMGVWKDAQDIVPEPDVNLSELPLPAEGSTTVHSYTGADGKTFYYTVTYPNQYNEVLDVDTATEVHNGSLDYSTVQTTTLQAGTAYTTPSGKISAYGEQIAPAILNMLKGLENYWLDAACKLAYDSFGLEFNNKNINVLFGVNAPYGADTTPTGYIDAETFFPVDSINVCINSVSRANIDPADINGKDLAYARTYLDRVIAHEMIHAVMFAAGLFKEDMPQFFTEGVAELVHGSDDYNSKSLEDVTELASDSARLIQALVLEAGTGTADAYPAGCMFLRYICQQSQPVNVEFGSPEQRIFTHETSQDIISDYKDGDQVNVGTGIELLGAATAGNDLFVSSNIGTIIMRDVRGKVLNFADSYGNINGRGFVADAAGTVDGRIFGESEVIYGADYADNEIYAGNGGTKLWGGSYGNDKLFGGAGYDEFIAGVYCGNDTIYNAGDNDVINLAATSLEQISSSSISADGVNLNFTDGSSLNVVGNVGATFKLADGSAYVANQSSEQWTKA